MPDSLLSLPAEWETLSEGTDEERACFAAIGIFARGRWLTEAHDVFVERVRQKVHLSAYRLAEWLAWNWWRLRWEPCAPGRRDWGFAHRLTTIGGGYVWPNVTIQSDGQEIELIARPTAPAPGEPLRYLSSDHVLLPAAEFENAVTRFVEQVRGQLRAKGLVETNLDRIWADVVGERAEKDLARRRQLEAMLGYEPDEGPREEIDGLLADARTLGEAAVTEIAAARIGGEKLPSAAAVREAAGNYGTECGSPEPAGDAIARLLESREPTPAWNLGSALAQAVRGREHLGTGPIEDEQLAGLAAVDAGVLDPSRDGPPFSFLFEGDGFGARVVLRKTTWVVNRRFDLARLLADRLARQAGDRLFPATRAHTFRQKMQRAFAAELLCPLSGLLERLDGDLSDEAIEGAAEYYNVADLAVRTTLVCHGRLEQEDLDRARVAG